MSNAKRFLSVILAIIMVCSTLVIGANAAYYAYKDAAITTYNELDEPVLTTQQYASAAVDEVDRMLDEEQLKFEREDIVVGDVDLTSVNATMDSVYTLVNSALFTSLKGMLGDLGSLSVNAFRPESEGGVRRSTDGTKSDLDVLYAVLEFLNDNKAIVVKFVNGNINLGTILPSLVDVSDYTDVNKLLKSLLYEATYVDADGEALEAPDNIATYSIDTMVQDLIDRYVIDELTVDDVHLGSYFEGHTDISSGTMYDMIDQIVKVCYNAFLVPLLNGSVKKGIDQFCGFVFTEDEDGVETVDRSGINQYAELLNVDYEIPEYEFTDDPFPSQFNNVVKSISDAMINSTKFQWQSGDTTMFKTNVVNLAKAALVNTGDDFFASYIEVATPEEVEAMSAEELTAYILRAIINGSVDEMYIPESATTLREFGYYTLSQLLATAVPELDFSSMDKNSTDTLIVMGIDYAIYSINANLDMGLEYVYTMDGVDEQLATAAQYGIDNYGGLLNGLDLDSVTGGWNLLDTVLFGIIDASWLPVSTTKTTGEGTVQDFLIDGLINNILDLDFDAFFAMFDERSDSELKSTPKQVVLNTVRRIINVIFPNAIQSATSIDAIATNSALAGTVGAIFDTLWNYKEGLLASILPTLCGILDLTNKQEFEFPKLTYDKMVYSNSGIFDFDVKIRNNSTGINTGYTDANGVFHQDALYTYEITSVTSSALDVTSYPATLAGGVTNNIHLNGSISTNEAVLKVVIKYNVKTETGSNLTSAPIEEDVYIYLTKTASDEETSLTSTAAGGFAIADGPKNVYATGMGDITDITLTVANGNSTEVTLTPTSNLSTTASTTAKKYPRDEDGTCWFELNTESVTVIPMVDDNPGVGRVTVFKTTDAYKALTGEEKKAKWDSMIAAMTTYNARTGALSSYPKCASYTLGVTDGTNTSSTTATNLFLYNDYGLGSLVDSELTKHRQASAYTGTTEWTAYQTALETAVSAVYSPFVASTFASTTGKASKYEAASTALVAAIEALEATAKGAGVESLQTIIDSYNPDNGELEYDDAGYNYFAVADYVDYTYYNYRDEYRDAMDMIERATVPNEETGEVEVINELDKTYMEWRLSLYGSRLLSKTVNKQHLAAELATPTRTDITSRQSEWSAESWAEYQRALTFATSVNNTAATALKQSKVNTALDKLLQAEKELTVASAGGGETEETSYAPIDEATVVTGTSGDVITGITLGADDLAAYFTVSNCTVEVTENAKGGLSTGAVVTIKDANDNVLKTYTVSVYADVDGDSDIGSGDISLLAAFYGGSTVPADCEKTSADVDTDGDLSSGDLAILSQIYGGGVTADFVNRTTN